MAWLIKEGVYKRLWRLRMIWKIQKICKTHGFSYKEILVDKKRNCIIRKFVKGD